MKRNIPKRPTALKLLKKKIFAIVRTLPLGVTHSVKLDELRERHPIHFETAFGEVERELAKEVAQKAFETTASVGL